MLSRIIEVTSWLRSASMILDMLFDDFTHLFDLARERVNTGHVVQHSGVGRVNFRSGILTKSHLKPYTETLI